MEHLVLLWGGMLLVSFWGSALGVSVGIRIMLPTIKALLHE